MTNQDYFKQNKRDSLKTDFIENGETGDVGGFYLDKKLNSNMQRSNNQFNPLTSHTQSMNYIPD